MTNKTPPIIKELEKEIPYWLSTSVAHTGKDQISVECFLEHLERERILEQFLLKALKDQHLATIKEEREKHKKELERIRRKYNFGIKEVGEGIERMKITKKKGVLEAIFGDKRKQKIRIHTNMDVGYNKALQDIKEFLRKLTK